MPFESLEGNFNNDPFGLGVSNNNGTSFLQWDLSDLPAGATINSATVNLYMYYSIDSTTKEMFFDGYSPSDDAGLLPSMRRKSIPPMSQAERPNPLSRTAEESWT